MKWSIFVGFLTLCSVRYGEGGALRCSSENDDPLCTTERRDENVPGPPVEVPARVVDAECLAGSEWESNCHYCRCSDSGVAECLKQNTCDNGLFGEPIQCKPNTTFARDCNTCTCLENGLGLCTLDICAKSNIPLKSELRSGKECAPGSSWKSQCRQCECDGKGLAVCADLPCEGQESSESIMGCAPSTVWKNECNTCWCTTAGRAVCTRMGCVASHDFEAESEKPTEVRKESLAKTDTSSKNSAKIVCMANRMFIKDCNTCWCNEDGTGYYCTRRVCVPEQPEEIPIEDVKPENFRVIKRVCRPDEVFELDCNMCRCNPDGKGFSCTRRACLDTEDVKNTPISRKIRASQEPAKACQPGQEFRLDCNKCLCDNEGQDFSCTRMDCDAVNNNGGTRTKRETSEQVSTRCEPGSVFKRECNDCRCTQDGQFATCTLKRCQKNEVDAEITTESNSGFRCNAGEQFKQSCNDCTCSADGKSVFCTLRLCDQDFLPTK